MAGRQPGKSVLVAFCAHNADPYPRIGETGEYRDADLSNPLKWGPALRLVADPKSKLFDRVSDFYYLCHPSEPVSSKRKLGRRDIDVARDTKRELERLVPADKRPSLHERTWKTNAAPNDHKDIFEFLQRELRTIRALHPKAELVLQLSSGTSAMHAALFLAGSAGIVTGPIRLIQSERGEGALAREHQAFSDVDLTLPTVLQVARQTAAVGTLDDAAPIGSYDQAQSPKLRAALRAATNAAQVRFPVLLRGERGVGKTSFAKMIRAAGPFRKKALDHSWPSIACGQFLDAQMLYVELCGAKAGAYTGLRQDRKGLVALANGDTLFLDEVHDLSGACQRAIIRVIEDGKYTRLGESDWKESRFRLITGTNQPDAMLRERLHADFLDRIRDLEVSIPPLRECPEDHPWMWRATCEQVSHETGVTLDLLDEHSGRVLRAIKGHPLPGNWRDLRRIAVRLATEVLAEPGLSSARVEQLQREVFNERGTHSLSDSDPLLPNRHARNQLRKLEETLGPGCEKFWEACERGAEPRMVLEELLGDRHRATRALGFIKKTWPNRNAARSHTSD